MDSVLRAAAMYVFLLLVFRIAGRRALGELTSFDFVLLLIVSEATQQAMLGEDGSMTNAFLVILTLLLLNVGLSLWMRHSKTVSKWIDDVPTVIVEDGVPLKEAMFRARVNEDDVLEAARERQGLERMDQIKYAVLERTGGISIVPKPEARS